MATMYINYGSFSDWAVKISNDNDKLLEYLNEICKIINNLESTYQSNASTAIREKINGMKPNFEQYYQVVETYAKFVKTTGDMYKNIENINVTNDFI